MILLITAVFPPEPVVSALIVSDLAEALSENWDVKVVSPKPSRPLGFNFKEETFEKRKFEHIMVNSFTYPKSNIIGRMIESYSFGKHSVDYINNFRNEIKCIYLNTWPLLSQYLIIKAAKKYSIPSIIHIQDIYPESLVNRYRLLGSIIRFFLLPIDRFILRNAIKIIAISDNMSHYLSKTREILRDKIHVIYNWQNEKDFIKTRYNNLPNETDEAIKSPFVFMYLGNIGPAAGVDFLIKSFVNAQLNNAQLIIAGSGSMKNECIKIASLYKQANIVFMDVPVGEVHRIQAKADLMLLPLRRGASLSSIPSKLSAYMFSGKPIIACVEELSDTAHAILQARCGWIVKPGDTLALSEVIKAAANLPVKELNNYGQNAFNFALQNYTTHNNLQKLVNIVESCAKARED